MDLASDRQKDARDCRYLCLHAGDRSRAGARGLWASLPLVYRQYAVAYTDFWEAYEQVIPSQRHQAVGKETGQTNPIERFNCTLRQRVSRLVRKTLSFSKKLENHIGVFGTSFTITMHPYLFKMTQNENHYLFRMTQNENHC